MKDKAAVLIELAIALGLVALLIVVQSPLGYGMSGATIMAVSVVFVVLFVLFGIMVVRERARDEREALHRMMAGRVAYLAGMAVAGAGIIYQMFHHMYEVDLWLVLTFGVMVGVKAIGHAYGRLKK